MEIEKIKFIDDIKLLNKYKKYNHIYFGSEFCEKKLFTIKDLEFIVESKSKQKIILVFPYLTQSYLEKVKEMFTFISLHLDIFCEIVFNDWGLFYFVRNNYPNIKLVLGRLLTKQKTDPFINEIIYSNQKMLSSINNIFIPKKISKETKDYFSKSIISSSIFHKFMIENNIVRVEIDNINWKTNIDLPKQIKVSIYYPYVKISTTRYCSYLNMSCTTKCNKLCKNKNIQLNKYKILYNYIIKGNSINYKNISLPTSKDLIKNNIDRIIINE